MLSKKLKQIIERDRINDRERLAAIKFMQNFMALAKMFNASPLGLLLKFYAKTQQNKLTQNSKDCQLCSMTEE